MINQISQDLETPPLISVVVPVFNEEATVSSLLDRLYNEPTNKEIIVVDDGSYDGSRSILESWIAKISKLNSQTLRIVLICHKSNRGKGRAVRTGLEVANGRFFIVQDADLELCPSHYKDLLKPLTEGKAHVVLGRRISSANSSRILHQLGILLANSLLQFLYGYRVSDCACCYKITSTKILRAMELKCEGFEFCPEFLAKSARMRLTTEEIDVNYAPRNANEGKKLQILRDGLRLVVTLVAFRTWKPAREIDNIEDQLLNTE